LVQLLTAMAGSKRFGTACNSNGWFLRDLEQLVTAMVVFQRFGTACNDLSQ